MIHLHWKSTETMPLQETLARKGDFPKALLWQDACPNAFTSVVETMYLCRLMPPKETEKEKERMLRVFTAVFLELDRINFHTHLYPIPQTGNLSCRNKYLELTFQKGS